MREQAGFVAFHLAFVAPGMALLYALGFVRRLREVPAAIGPAYLAGVAGLMSLLLALLTAGAAVRLPALVLVAGTATGALAVAGFVLARRRAAQDAPAESAPRTPLEKWVTWLGIGLLAAFFAIGNSAFVNLPTVGDAWTIWSYKGLALFHLGGTLDNELFTRPDIGPAHPYYPLLQPLFQSLFFRSVGEVQLQQFHSVLWILFASFVWTVAWLGRTRGLPLFLLLVPTAALTFTSKSQELVGNGYADVTWSAFAGAGAFSVGLWLRDGAARYAILGGVLLMGSANTKNEGVLAAIAVLGVAAVFVLAQRWRGWRTWLAAAVIAGAGALPWMLWRSAKGVESEHAVPLGDALGNLDNDVDRVPKTFTALFDRLADAGQWTYLVPCLLVLTVVCLVRGTARREAAFYLAVPVVMTLGLVFVYWTGTLPIDYWLTNSIDRTVTGIVYVCGAGLAHLTALLLSDVSAARNGSRRPDRAPP